MEAKSERALVGLFVLVAAGLLVATLFSLTGFLQRSEPIYKTYLKNAGGLAPGSQVRYAGGPPVGRVEEVHSDPKDPTRMEVTFRVHSDVPVKTDSKARISTLGALGDNFLGIVPGSPGAPRAPSGSTLQGMDYTGFDELATRIGELAPQATQVLQNLNARITELQQTIARVNDLLNSPNRKNISRSLANVRGMLEEDRPLVHSTLGKINDASAKLGPLMDDFKKTMSQANEALSHVDATLMENRPDVRQAVVKMRETLTSAASLTDQLDRTLNANSENIDEILDNMRIITENLKQFTHTIKTRPYTLIRASGPRQRQPGEVSRP
ncbi:MAG: MlaD family protein [Candidatus Acidiferrales bacterium]